MLAAEAAMDHAGSAEGDVFMDALDPLLRDAFRLAYALVGSADEAADIVQEATVRAWRHRRSFRPGAALRPWFLAIVANQSRRTMRSPWWSVLTLGDLESRRGEIQPAHLDEAQDLRQGLLQLSRRDRLILILRYYLDLSFDDVATTLGISTGAARVRAHRALARLRPIIGAPEEDA